MVAAAAITRPNTPPNPRIQWVEEDRTLSSTALSIMQQIHSEVNGLTPTISCESTFAANKYTLTPLNISPVVAQYYSFMSFAFVASNSSTSLVTATVVPKTGSLNTLKVMKANGASQATNGDLVANLFYLLYYVDTLDGGSGAFVLK